MADFHPDQDPEPSAGEQLGDNLGEASPSSDIELPPAPRDEVASFGPLHAAEAEEANESPGEKSKRSPGGPGFGLSFIEGKALVGFDSRSLNDWLLARDFCLEVPNIRFPFDVSAGAETFRNRKCRLVGLRFELLEEGFKKYVLSRLAPCLGSEHSPLGELEIGFGEGFLEISGTISAGRLDETGSDASRAGSLVPFTLKMAADESADKELRLLLHDARLYAPASLPAPAVAVALLDLIAKSDLPVVVESPSIVRLDPVFPYLKWLLPRQGWKLPDTRGARLSAVRITRGRAELVFDAGKSAQEGPDRFAMKTFFSALEGSLAFASAEKALAEGRYDDARRAWLEAEGPLPDHPFAAERLLALLLADPSTLDDALDLSEAWLARDPSFVPALLTRAMAKARLRAQGAAADFLKVAELASTKGEVLGARQAAIAAGGLAELEAATFIKSGETEEAQTCWSVAVRAFEKALSIRPSDRRAIIALSRLYPKLGDLPATERILKKRLSVALSDVERSDVHLSLGRLLSGDYLSLGAPEWVLELLSQESEELEPYRPDMTRAKLHLDAALRYDPQLAEGWLALGRACMHGKETLRAIRCLDRARDLLMAEGRQKEAAAVSRQIAELWEHDLDHPENAVLRYQQVLDVVPDDLEARLRHASLSLRLGHVSEAESGLRLVLESVARASAAAVEARPLPPDLARPALTAHRMLGYISSTHYNAQRSAARHLESALALCAEAEEESLAPVLLQEIVSVAHTIGDLAYLADTYDRAAAVETDPVRAAEYLAEAAHIYLNLGDSMAARARAAEARVRDPRGLRPMVARATVEASCGAPEDYEAALTDLVRHIEASEERAIHLLELGQLRLEKLRAPEAALAPLAEARDCAERADVVFAAAELHVRASRETHDLNTLSQSLLAFAAVSADRSLRAEALLEAAAIHEDAFDEPTTALELLKEARKIDPQNARAAWHLGRILLKVRQPQEAWSALLDMKALGGAEAAGVSETLAEDVMGRAALFAGDVDSASRYLLRATTREPGDEELESLTLSVFEQLGRREEAAAILRMTALARYELGDRAGSAARYRRAAELAESALGDLSTAAADLDSALAATLSATEAATLVGSSITFEAHHEEALEAAQDRLRLALTGDDTVGAANARLYLAALASDSLEAALLMSARADDLVASGSDEAAINSLERAVALEPRNIERREHLASLLTVKRPGEALVHLEQLLEEALTISPCVDTVLAWRLAAADAATAAILPDRASHHLSVYLAYRPSDLGATTRLIALHQEAGDYPNLYSVLVHHGQVLLSCLDRGENTFNAAASALLDACSIAAEKLDHTDLARAAIDPILERDRDYAPALLALLPLLKEPEWADVRADALARLAAGEPCPARRASFLCDRADTLSSSHREKAREAYAEALVRDPSSQRAAEGLASIAWMEEDLPSLSYACFTRARQAATTGASDAAARYLATARIQLWLGVKEEALRSLDHCLDEVHRDFLSREQRIEALHLRLESLPSEGKFAAALSDLDELIKLHRTHAPATARAALHRKRAELRRAMGDETGAREDWTEAHRLDRDDPLAVDRLMALAELEDDARAMARLYATKAYQAERRGDREAMARALLRRAELLAGPLENSQEAVEELRRASRVAPEGDLDSSIFQCLWQLLLDDERIDEAIEVTVSRAVRLKEREAASLLLETAGFAASLCRHDAALACTRAAYRYAPNDHATRVALLQRLIEAGAVEECEPLARWLSSQETIDIARTLDLGETEAEEHIRRACLSLLEIDPQAALPALQRLFDSRPSDEPVAEQLTRLYASRDEHSAAERILAAHLRAAPRRRHPEIALRLADLAAARDDSTREAYWLKEAFAYEEHSPSRQQRNRLLSAVLQSGDDDEFVAVAKDLLTELAGQDPTEASIELAIHARALVSSGFEERALELLAALEELRGESRDALEAWFLAARAVGRAGAIEEALESLIQHLIEEGEAEEAARNLFTLGSIHESRGDIESACDSFHEAMLHGGFDGELLGKCLGIARQVSDAELEVELLEFAVEAHSKEPAAAGYLCLMAELFSGSLEDPKRAEQALRDALEHDPSHQGALDSLRDLLVLQGRKDELIALYESHSESINPEARALLMLSAARQLIEKEQADEALALLVEAGRIDATCFEDAEAAALLDTVRSALGMHRERAATRLSSPRGSGFASRALEAGDILRDKVQDHEEAAAAYRLAYEEGDGQRAAERLRGVLAAMEDYSGLARLALDDAAKAPAGPARVALLRSAGDLLAKAKDDSGAIEAWRAALEQAPTDQMVLDRLRVALEEANRHAELAVLLQTLAEGTEGRRRADALLEAARLHFVVDATEEGLSCLMEAESADPNYDEATRHLADALWATGDKDEAVVRYLRILPKEPLGGRSQERVTEHLEAEGRLRELAEVTTARAMAARAADEKRLAKDLYLRAVRLWLRAGEPSATRAAAFGAFELDPSDEEAFEAVTRSLDASGDPKWTVEVLEKHVASLPLEGSRYTDQLRRLIEARLAAGDPDGAETDLRALTKLAKDNVSIVTWALDLLLDSVLSSAGDICVAIADHVLSLVASEQPVSPAHIEKARLILARRALEEDKPRHAVEHLEAALSLGSAGESSLSIARLLIEAAAAAQMPAAVGRAYLLLANVEDKPGVRLEALRNAAEAFRDAGDSASAFSAHQGVFDQDPGDAQAFEALLTAASATADKLALLRAHADSLGDKEKRQALLLELARLAEQDNEQGLAARARVEAWRLDTHDVGAAEAAIPALRVGTSGSTPLELADALSVVARAVDGRMGLKLLAEAVATLDDSGEEEVALERALEAVESAKRLVAFFEPGAEPDELLSESVLRVVEVAARQIDDPIYKRELLELSASVGTITVRCTQLFAAAECALEAGDPDGARADLEAALEASPRNIEVGQRLLEILFLVEDLDAATRLAVFISTQESSTEAVLRAASFAEEAGRFDLVVEAIEAAMKLDRRDSSLCPRLIAARTNQGDPVKAAAAAAWHVERLQEIEADSAKMMGALTLAAELHLKSEQPHVAANYWLAVLGHEPENADALQCLEDWHRSRKAWPELVDVHLLRAERLAAAGMTEPSAQAMLLAADAAKDGGELSRAVEILEAALARAPGNSFARTRLTELAELAGHQEDSGLEARALQAAFEAAEEPRAQAGAALALARHHRRTGHTEPATEFYTLAFSWARAESGDISAGMIGEILREAGVWLAESSLSEGDALSAYDFARLSRDAGAADREARRLEARAAEAAGELESARDAWKALSELEDQDDASLEGLIRVSAILEDSHTELWALEQLAERAKSEGIAADRWLAVAARATTLARHQDATRALFRAFEIEPTSRTVFNSLRRRLEANEDTAGLLDLWRRFARSAQDETSKAEAFFEEGRLARDAAENLERAAEAFERCLAIAPDRREAAVELVETLHQLGAYSRAEALLRTMNDGGPGFPAHLVHERLAAYAAASDRLEEALISYKRALERHPTSIESWKGGLAVARSLGDLATEAEFLAGLLKADTEAPAGIRAELLEDLAEARLGLGDFDGASESYQKAHDLAPTNREILASLLKLHKERGRWSDAAKALSTLAGLADDDKERAALLVQLSDLSAGDLDDSKAADTALAEAVAYHGESTDAWRRILLRSVVSKDDHRIARAAKRLCELGQEDAFSRWPLPIGRALLSKGEIELGASVLESGSRARPEDRELASEAASALIRAGRPEAAVEVLDALAGQTIEPSDYRAAAEAALFAGDEQGFTDRMARAVDDPDLAPAPRAWATHAIALRLARQGDHERAITALKEAAAQLPGERLIKRDLARLLAEVGREADAKSIWQSLARSDPSDALAISTAAEMDAARDVDKARLLGSLASYLRGESGETAGEGNGSFVDLSSVTVDESVRAELADPVASGPMGVFLRAMAPTLEPLFPSDLRRYGVSSNDLLLPEKDSSARRAREWANVIGARDFNLYRGERLGFEICIENTLPPSIIVGASLLDRPSAELDQLLCRAVDLMSAGYALPGKFADGDVGVLVRLTLSFFHPKVEVPVPADKLVAYHEAMGRLCPPSQKKEIEPLASDALAALPRFDPGSLAPSMRRTADRVALLCTGDVHGTLEAVLRLDPRAAGAETDRAKLVRTEYALFDLCRFMLRDDAGSLYRRVRRLEGDTELAAPA